MSRPFLSCLSCALLGALALAACDRPQAAAAPAPAATAATHAFRPGIDAGDFAAHVQALASDGFEGRGPGTAGEDRTVEYIQAQMQRIGLQPGYRGQWFQTVPMVETTTDPATTLALEVAGKPRVLRFGDDMVIGTRSGQAEVKLEASPLVFVGYGVDAPEQQWNDYAGIDVRGKTVVMLVNDPGFHAGDDSLFEGKRMTYYGRWTYKFEEAARKGAAAALIVHDDAGASYGWDVVKSSWSGAQHDLPAAGDPAPRLPAQGWLSGEAANALFAGAGLDLAQLRAAANKRGFKAVPMDATLSLDLKSTIAQKSSRNVVGLLPGRAHPDEAVLYMAHWDHLGKHDDEAGPDGSADTIYNGAVDNATGVAGILELAEAFAHQQPAPERSLLFLAVTLEESGLLGSQYYVAHPALPLAQTVAAFNLDAMSVSGRSRDITVVGLGSSQLEDLLKPVAEQQGRSLHAEAHPEAGGYFRSDHFNFAKAGVPALYIDGGEDLVDGGTAAGAAAAKDYNEHRYHKPGDEYDAATWKLDGAIQDLETVYAVGRDLAASQQWPNWYAGNPFKAARDQARAGATTAPAAK
ncbi:M28 family metallopeptidase [Cognatiluteimonas weifangensis]|uniref:M20/M25/M40 family metallo-hydrolase n=1 Tax=Cognatiluteimonas weifangensis TaxID=2303539 RepID=A0A372DHZ6_9GAMM|nr:M28 family metallopeptidase [Luteimonas weifangensis]RFP59094.1 M20/M25/M40 family metallo-hydrolase [Luteimonas weifangensis]